jgi:hypothetical protein
MWVRRRRGVRRLAIVAAVFGLFFGNVSSASAMSMSVPATILGSGCSTTMSWWGGYPAATGNWPSKRPKGTVKVCWFKYRLKDQDPNGDYYAVDTKTTWTISEGAASYPANMYQSLASSLSSKDNVFDSTGSHTSSTSCSTGVSLSFSIGIASASVSPKVCRTYSFARYSKTSNGSDWSSAKAGGLRVVETGFMQKVPNGLVPKFDFVFGIPRYNNAWYEAGGWWTSSKAIYWVSYSNK